MPVIVTSMSQAYREMTNDCWLESLKRTNPDATIYIVSEDIEPDLYFHRLDSTLGHAAFCEAARYELLIHPELDQTDYRWQPIRFSYKPFAIKQVSIAYPAEELYWFDADVEFTGPILYSEICPRDLVGVSYLGRAAYNHSEAGFLGIGPFAARFIIAWFNYYKHGTLFNLSEWHDVVAMDRAMIESSMHRYNLSEDIHDKHPWPKTILAKFSRHYKGPGRKKDKFGSNDALHGVVYRDV